MPPPENALAPPESERPRGVKEERIRIHPCRALSGAAPVLALLALLLGGAGAARAQSADDTPPDCASTPAPGATLAQAQALFAGLEPHCLRNAVFYRQQGQWLLKHGNYAAAIEALERALLLDPDHLGTQLDYAQALIMVGDADSASAILSVLQALPDVPPHLLPLLGAQLQALQQVLAVVPAPQGLISRVVFSQSVGTDSNLNNATTATNITLTYPTLDLNLPLADSNRPRSGATAFSTLQWTGLLARGSQMWLLQAQGRARHTAHAPSRYQQADLAATWLQNPSASRQWIAQAEHAQLHWDYSKLYASHKLGMQHQWAYRSGALDCRSAVGAELENRSFPGNRTLDGAYHGAIFTLACQQQSSLSLQLRTGVDRPDDPTRAGGQQRQHEARAQWQFDALGNRWQLEYNVQHQQDASGYSPLLSRNAVRRVTRQTLRLEASRQLDWPAWGEPQWFGQAEFTRQSSNLPIFASRRNAVQTGLRWTWP